MGSAIPRDLVGHEKQVWFYRAAYKKLKNPQPIYNQIHTNLFLELSAFADKLKTGQGICTYKVQFRTPKACLIFVFSRFGNLV